MRRLIVVLSCVTLLPLTTGCQSTYRTRPVEVMVRDAESHQPIANAEVQMVHHHTASDSATATTGNTGVALVEFVPNGSEPAMISITAKGYQNEFKVVSDSDIIKISPKPFFGGADAHPADFVLDVYPDPPFDVMIVLTTGFRGLLKADVSLRDNPVESGQRTYPFYADRNGEVKINGPKILDRVAIVNYRARYEGGDQTLGEMDEKTVGIRWLKKDGTKEIFVVGTQTEFEQFRKELVPQQNMNPGPSDAPKKGGGRGGKGGGGGRRGGGGGGGGGSGGGY
ncbi:carboxypeptidase-like regulatory domain-containing protein [Zavarzinella formosa]|uniref:carboxypeptidase-like regulatory domain-containing protein n=1 Tax=Zavarzinella formosa TaxID=360055 RepID=UPI000370B4E3|nr:carboxypeptidase-like regulatory domain-containing protein [Zavarzinella formosa]